MTDDKSAPPNAKPSALRSDNFVKALTDYVMDPSSWGGLDDALNSLDRSGASKDTEELLVQLSKAETLSWQLKNESADLAGDGFAFLLLDDRDRIIAHSDNLPVLDRYLTVSKTQKLEFSDVASRISFEDGKSRQRAAPGGHTLVEITQPNNSQHRYGYLVAENDIPEPLKLLGKDATRALLIATDQSGPKLRCLVQASFALTSAETDIMLKIGSGMTLKQAAIDLNVSINTVRNHLQAIYSKSGINRQGGLVLVVTQLSIILSASGSNGSPPQSASQDGDYSATKHFMVLPDQRRIAYRTYGNPMGKPVLYLHENIGSSKLLPGTQHLAEEFNLYLVAPERPGCGHSDSKPDFGFDSICDDLVQLLDHLRIPDCLILGFLSGGGYGLKMANNYPDRISHLMLVAARPPAPQTGKFKLLATLRQKMAGQPWVLSTIFNILRNRASEESFGRLIMNIYGSVPQDRQYLEAHPGVFRHMVDCTLESMSVSTAGVINELQCFNAATDETLPNLRAPITIWHGTEDNLASLERLSDFLGDRVREVRIFEGAGSLIVLQYWREILALLSEKADVP